MVEDRLFGVHLGGDVRDGLGVTLRDLLVISLLRRQQDFNQLQDGAWVCALRERCHGRFDQIKPLLKVIEANDLVDA